MLRSVQQLNDPGHSDVSLSRTPDWNDMVGYLLDAGKSAKTGGVERADLTIVASNTSVIYAHHSVLQIRLFGRLCSVFHLDALYNYDSSAGACLPFGA